MEMFSVPKAKTDTHSRNTSNQVTQASEKIEFTPKKQCKNAFKPTQKVFIDDDDHS